MTKVDWFSAIERGMAAQAEKTKPSLKAVGPGGAGGDLYRNTNNINVVTTTGRPSWGITMENHNDHIGFRALMSRI